MLSIIPPNSLLIVAISGGPDSVYLTHHLLNFTKTQKNTIILAHFNHKTRTQESTQDEKFVTQLATKLKLPIHIERTTTITKSEAKMRLARYAFLEKIRQQEKADYIVTAHHQNDQIETIIFNLLRGTGPSGLTGMKPINNFILRPLLDTPKKKIINWLKKNNIKYRQDSSNLDINYKRNLIRHQILPIAKQINPRFDDSVLRTARTLSIQQNYIDQITHSLIKSTPANHKPTPILSLTKFKSLHPAIQSNWLKIVLNPHVPPNKQLSAKAIDEVRNILLFSRSGSQKILYDTLSISKKNDKIYLRLLRWPPANKAEFLMRYYLLIICC